MAVDVVRHAPRTSGRRLVRVVATFYHGGDGRDEEGHVARLPAGPVDATIAIIIFVLLPRRWSSGVIDVVLQLLLVKLIPSLFAGR